MTATTRSCCGPQTHASGRTIVALLLLAMTVVLAWQALTSADEPARAVVWGGLALAGYGLALLWSVGGRAGGGLGLVEWRFGSWILVWWAVSYGLASVTWDQPQAGTVAAEIALSSVLRALSLVAVGMTAWVVGYRVGPGSLARRLAARGVGAFQRRFTPEVRSPAAPWILYLIGSVARIVSAVTSGRFGYVGNASSALTSATAYGHMLSLCGYCCLLAVSAAALQVYREHMRSARVTLAVLLLLEIAVGVVSADKENFLLAAVAFLVPYCAARRRLPKMAVAVTAAVFLLIVIPFNAAYRSTIRNSQTTLTSGQALDAAPQIFSQVLNANGLVNTLPASANYLLLRVREIDAPAIIMQRTPGQVAYLSPIQLLTVPAIGLVPRWIWPGKPILAPNYQVTQIYYGKPADLYTASTTTPIGSLFQHGGWLPVIFGMLLFGCGVRLFDDVFDIFENLHATFILPLLLPSVVIAEGGLDTILTDIPAALIIWALCIVLIFRPRSRSSI